MSQSNLISSLSTNQRATTNTRAKGVDYHTNLRFRTTFPTTSSLCIKTHSTKKTHSNRNHKKQNLKQACSRKLGSHRCPKCEITSWQTVQLFRNIHAQPVTRSNDLGRKVAYLTTAVSDLNRFKVPSRCAKAIAKLRKTCPVLV